MALGGPKKELGEPSGAAGGEKSERIKSRVYLAVLMVILSRRAAAQNQDNEQTEDDSSTVKLRSKGFHGSGLIFPID